MVNPDLLTRVSPRVVNGTATALGGLLVAFTVAAALTGSAPPQNPAIGMPLAASVTARSDAPPTASATAPPAGDSVEQQEALSTIDLKGASSYPSFDLELAEASALSLALFATTTGPSAAPIKVGLRVNGTEAAAFELGVDATVLRADVPKAACRAGQNHFEFHGATDASALAFDELWIADESSHFGADLGNAAPGVELTGLAPTETEVPPPVLRMTAARAAVSLPLRAKSADYAVAVLARNFSSAAGEPLVVAVNGRPLGKVKLAASWIPDFEILSRDDVPAGPLRIELDSPAYSSVALRRIDVSPLLDRVLLDVGSATARAYLLDGFSGDEGSKLGNSAWSNEAVSHIVLPLEPSASPYRIELHGHALSSLSPLKVELRVNRQSMGVVELGAAPATQTLVVPQGAFRHGVNVLELDYAATAAPHDANAASGDTRRLAVRLDWLKVRPVAP